MKEPRLQSTSRTGQPAAIAVLRVALFAALAVGLSRTVADPDLWGHVRFGLDILASGIPAVDPYSFTSDIPWMNHEWLAEIAMALAWSWGGSVGLVVLKMALVVVVAACAISALRAAGVRMPALDGLAAVSLLALWPRLFVLRPQVFSLALFAVLLLILVRASAGRRWSMAWLPPLFALWVNLHGGWIVGLAVLLGWLALAASPLRRTTASLPALSLACAGSVLATLLNPYGVGMWRFLAGTVRPDRPDIADWQPLFRMGGAEIAPWLLSAAVVVAAARHWRTVGIAPFLVVVGLGLASLRVNRLDAFFALAAVILLAPSFGDATRVPPGGQDRSHPAVIPLAVALAALAIVPWHARLACIRLDGAWMPDRESAAFIAANHFEGRLIAWFGWGEYAIWHFAPGLRVSFDGRRETVYSAGFIDAHLRLYFQPSTTPLFERLNADYAWLPPNLPLVPVLQSQGWHTVFEGPRSVVLARHEIVPVSAPDPGGPACFPGP